MSILKKGMYASEKIDSANWLDGWSCRQKITVPASSVGESITDFPVFVDLSFLDSVSGSNWWSNVNTFGQDIRVTLSDGVTQVPMELMTVVSFTTYGFIYFKADVSAFSDTGFWIYCGNYDAEVVPFDDPLGRNAVWSDGYALVVHDGASYDSTGRLTDVVSNAQEPAGYQTTFGYITRYQTTEYTDFIDTDNLFIPLELSCAFMHNISTTSLLLNRNGSAGLSLQKQANAQGMHLGAGYTSGTVGFTHFSGFPALQLNMLAAQISSPVDSNAKVFKNGVQIGTSTNKPRQPNYGTDNKWRIANDNSQSIGFSGAIGLLRLSSKVRSSAHHKLEYDLHFNNYNTLQWGEYQEI